MKNVILYGNCQIEYIENYLKSSSDFRRNYKIILSKPVFAIENSNCLQKKIEQCDVFIYQNVDGEFQDFLKTDVIKNKLKQECKCINIPVAYFTGYFPQYVHNPENRITEDYVWGKYPYGDSNIVSFMRNQSNRNIDKIESFLKKLNSSDYYSSDYVNDNAEKSLLELRKREKKCDFTISNIIEEFYNKEFCFFTVNHPNYRVIRYMSEKILEKLDISADDIHNLVIEKLDHVMIPIYPSVAKVLSLKFISENQKYNYLGKEITFDYYIKDYIRYCYDIADF